MARSRGKKGRHEEEAEHDASEHGAAAAEGAEVEVGGGELTIYDNVHPDGSLAWKDLCRGPHLPTTKRIPAFKLMRSAAA